MKKLIAIALSSTMLTGAAHAIEIVGGETTVTVLLDIAELDVDTQAVDDAEVAFDVNGQPVFEFDITSGELTSPNMGELNHTGGALFRAGTQSLLLEDFAVDLNNMNVFADVFVNGVDQGNLNVFGIEIVEPILDMGNPVDNADSNAYVFTIPEATLAILVDVFGEEIDFGVGDNFAEVAIDPEAVPVPAAALLFAPLAAGFVARRRRKDS